MQVISEKTIKLLSRSGLVLIFLSMAGSFVMAAMTISGDATSQQWEQLFGTLFMAVMGIAVYYLALSLFALIILKKKNASP